MNLKVYKEFFCFFLNENFNYNILIYSSNTFLGYVGSCIDITDNKKLEQDLMIACQAKSDFLALMSHEIRTPLVSDVCVCIYMYNYHIAVSFGHWLVCVCVCVCVCVTYHTFTSIVNYY